MKSKRVLKYKIILYLMLFLFLVFLAWLAFIKPYLNRTNLFKGNECEKAYDCECEEEHPDTDLVWCTCKYKKLFWEIKGICIKDKDFSSR